MFSKIYKQTKKKNDSIYWQIHFMTTFHLSRQAFSSTVLKKMLTVSARGMLVNSESTSRLAINNATYYGKTKRHFKVRSSEHMGLSALTGKWVKGSYLSTAVKDHLLFCVHFLHSKILVFWPTLILYNFILEIKESLLIMRDNPVLNKHTSSVTLFLYN